MARQLLMGGPFLDNQGQTIGEHKVIHHHYPPEKQVQKRVFVWFFGLVAVVIMLLVTANFTNFGSATSSLIGNLFSSTESPVQIDLVRTKRSLDDSHAFANALVLSNAELSQLNSLNRTSSSYDAWFVSRYAVDIGLTTSELVVEGNRNHTVRIIDIQPIVSCQSPLKGTLFYSPSAGGDPSTKLFLDLDNPHSIPIDTLGKDFFGNYTVSLNKGEQFTSNIIALTSKHFCKFTLAMTVLDGNKTVIETITNNGQPFQVIAMLDKYPSMDFSIKNHGGEFLGYQVLYVGGLMTPPPGLWAPVNPNTYDPYT